MGCGCNKGGSQPAPQVALNKVANRIANLHPAAQAIQNIQKLSEERRKVERLKREQLIKALSRP